jgi:hypothetical protein
MNGKDPGANQVQRLLDELCTDLGFCLPPPEQERLRQSPPSSVGAFADAVFAAEGMHPRLDKQLFRQVCERIEQRIGQWRAANASTRARTSGND